MYPISEKDWQWYEENVLDHNLNVAVRTISRILLPGGFDVSEDAPDTYEKLVAHFESGARLVVYSGGSDKSIFGDPEINYHFRAWHDWCHWQGHHDFSMRGEYAVYEMQCAHIVRFYGDTHMTRRWRTILFADGMGQKAYHEKYGTFPDDQFAFVREFIADPPSDLLQLVANG